MRLSRTSRVATITVAIALLAGACGSAGPADPTPGSSDPVDVLFVGNSLTYTNDLPAIVARLAEATGQPLTYGVLAFPNWSLQEHWEAGVAAQIRTAKAKWVILQQGPSSLPESRQHLVAWTAQIAPVVREAGGQPALYMVWPDRSRLDFLTDVAGSYAAAAANVGGTFVPAGETWREAWALQADLPLYGPDDFHPSYLGSLAAAWTMMSVLYGVEPSDLPALNDGVPAATLDVLRAAVEASVCTHAAPTTPAWCGA